MLTPSGRLLFPDVLPATDTVSHEAEVNDILDSPRFNVQPEPDDDSDSLFFAMSTCQGEIYFIYLFQSILMLPLAKAAKNFKLFYK